MQTQPPALQVVSIVLELTLKDAAGIGLVILARMWRYIRLGHGFIEAQHKKGHGGIGGTH